MYLDSIVLRQQDAYPMNRGAIATRQAIAAEGLSQNDAAVQVEADGGNFSRILNGKRLPGLALAVRIRARFGVETELWGELVDGDAAEPADPDDEEQTLPVLDPAPLQVVDTDSDPGPVEENPLDVKYPSSAPPPPPPSEGESERVSERPRRGSSDPLGYV